MNQQEYKERMNDPHYKALEVTNCDSGKPYVFISYRGNSWKKVLSDIVYHLQKEYHLNIYFDKEFASQTNVWIEQFKENMDASNCKAVLCFFDEGYVTSYATLLELMHAMNKQSGMAKHIYAINFPIDWNELKNRDDNTGLGVDSAENPSWKKELNAFQREFKFLMKQPEYSEIEEFFDVNNDKPKLNTRDCANIMRILQPQNKREYAETEDFYRQYIINPLQGDCPDVFSEKTLIGSRPDPEPRELKLDETTTLKEFETYCENIEFDLKLRKVRDSISRKEGIRQFFDYLMASFLRGCDQTVSQKDDKIFRLAGYNYCTYALSSNLDLAKPMIGASQFTWTSNARKAMRKEDMPPVFLDESTKKVKAGKLGKYSEIFEKLDEKLTIGEVLEKYRNEEEGFHTRDNDKIFKAWELIKGVPVTNSKRGIGELMV